MAQLKKFMFDNFVIEAKPEADLPEETVAGEELPILSTPQSRNEEDSSDTPANEIIIEPDVIEEVPPEKTYRQPEVDEMLNRAKQDSYEQGFRSSQNGIEAEANSLLMDINQKLTVLMADASLCHQEVEKQALEMVQAIVRKLVPSLMEEQAGELVTKFIADNFNNFKDEAKLSFYIHPDIISCAQEKIASLANSYDFEGKIALHKDASLAKNDCRIEWESGGVELKGAEQLAKLIGLMETAEDVKPEIKHE